jgi:hypothetical protein
MDAGSKDEYLELLDRLPLGRRMDDAEIERARKYAYHFFFRRMIPWGFMEPTGTRPPFRVALGSVAELGPGRDPGLDLVCEGVLNRSAFVYPAERTGAEEAPVGGR